MGGETRVSADPVWVGATCWCSVTRVKRRGRVPVCRDAVVGTREQVCIVYVVLRRRTWLGAKVLALTRSSDKEVTAERQSNRNGYQSACGDPAPTCQRRTHSIPVYGTTSGSAPAFSPRAVNTLTATLITKSTRARQLVMTRCLSACVHATCTALPPAAQPESDVTASNLAGTERWGQVESVLDIDLPAMLTLAQCAAREAAA